MLTVDEILAARAGKAFDKDGEKIGSVGEVYLDDETNLPAWVTVNTGLFGTSESFVPLVDGAAVEGEDLYLPFTKALIKDAPRQRSESHLEPDEEVALYVHYGLMASPEAAGVVEGLASPEVGEAHGNEAVESTEPAAQDIQITREPLNERADGITLSEGEEAVFEPGADDAAARAETSPPPSGSEVRESSRS